MAVTVKKLVARKQVEAAQTTQYTAPAATRAIIDKATVTNTGASNATISVNLPNTGDGAGAANLVLDARAIVPGETYLCPELVGQVLEPSDTISTLASAATTLTISIGGREIT